MFEKELLDFIVNSVRGEEKTKQNDADRLRVERESQDFTIPRTIGAFWAVKKSGELIAPCRTKAIHHREREKYYTTRLEECEKELKEKGVSVDVYDTNTGTYLNTQNIICSGAITGGQTQQFQPRIDQKLLDAVKNAKSRMLDHRDKAVQYEKYARAFTMNPEFTVRLDVEQVTYFGLGE